MSICRYTTFQGRPVEITTCPDFFWGGGGQVWGLGANPGFFQSLRRGFLAKRFPAFFWLQGFKVPFWDVGVDYLYSWFIGDLCRA